jgi:hypothetical protein
MKPLLAALKGAHLIAKWQEGGIWIYHYLLPDNRVMEVVI